MYAICKAARRVGKNYKTLYNKTIQLIKKKHYGRVFTLILILVELI